MELGLPDRPHAVLLCEHNVAGRASRAKHPVEVSLAVELAKLAEAALRQKVSACEAPEACS